MEGANDAGKQYHGKEATEPFERSGKQQLITGTLQLSAFCKTSHEEGRLEQFA